MVAVWIWYTPARIAPPRIFWIAPVLAALTWTSAMSNCGRACAVAITYTSGEPSATIAATLMSICRTSFTFRHLTAGFRCELHFQLVLPRSVGLRRHKTNGVTRTEAGQSMLLNSFQNVVGFPASHGILRRVLRGEQQALCGLAGFAGRSVIHRLESEPSGEIPERFKRIVEVWNEQGPTILTAGWIAARNHDRVVVHKSCTAWS